MPSRHDRRVVLILEGSRTKVDEPDFGIKKDFALSSLSVDSGWRRRDPSTVCEGLVRTITQQDVLWLEVGMDEVEIMQDLRSLALKRSQMDNENTYKQHWWRAVAQSSVFDYLEMEQKRCPLGNQKHFVQGDPWQCRYVRGNRNNLEGECTDSGSRDRWP